MLKQGVVRKAAAASTWTWLAEPPQALRPHQPQSKVEWARLRRHPDFNLSHYGLMLPDIAGLALVVAVALADFDFVIFLLVLAGHSLHDSGATPLADEADTVLMLLQSSNVGAVSALFSGTVSAARDE